MATDFRQLEEFRDKIQALADGKSSKFCDDCTKELAGRLLAKVTRRTPVGDYSGNAYTCNAQGSSQSHKGSKVAGMVGGTLRRGWTTEPINVTGNKHRIDIVNATHYAQYVEYGHRKVNNKGWVKGHFMMTDSVKELDAQAGTIVQKKLDKFLRDEGLG